MVLSSFGFCASFEKLTNWSHPLQVHIPRLASVKCTFLLAVAHAVALSAAAARACGSHRLVLRAAVVRRADARDAVVARIGALRRAVALHAADGPVVAGGAAAARAGRVQR